MYDGMQRLCGCERVNQSVRQQKPTKKRAAILDLYFVPSTENLTSFLGGDTSGSGSASRDGRLCNDGTILAIFEKKRGAKSGSWQSVRGVAGDEVMDVDVEVDTFVKEGVVDVGVDSDGLFNAGFGSGTAACERWAGFASDFVGSSDIDKLRPFVDLRCGVRDRCRPIDICSTVGTRPARSS